MSRRREHRPRVLLSGRSRRAFTLGRHSPWKGRVRRVNSLSRRKARLILHHGRILGRRLTPRQRRLLGAIASGYVLRKYRNPGLAFRGAAGIARVNPRRRRERSGSDLWPWLVAAGIAWWWWSSRQTPAAVPLGP